MEPHEIHEIGTSWSPGDDAILDIELILDDVADGNSVAIHRGGRPVAVVLSVAEYDALMAKVNAR
jgi:prevent-host-death family protein